MILIAGLGNPGRSYRSNRHNVGFMLLDRLSARLDAHFSRKAFNAIIAETRFENTKLILAKPQTMMNLSGRSIAPLAAYYKLESDQMMIAYDEIDLEFGQIRIRPGGGAGGHNGMRSIIELLGHTDFPRMRLGVGRPPGRMEAATYVLRDFSESEAESLNQFLDRALECLVQFLSVGLEASMNSCNPKLEP